MGTFRHASHRRTAWLVLLAVPALMGNRPCEEPAPDPGSAGGGGESRVPDPDAPDGDGASSGDWYACDATAVAPPPPPDEDPGAPPPVDPSAGTLPFATCEDALLAGSTGDPCTGTWGCSVASPCTQHSATCEDGILTAMHFCLADCDDTGGSSGSGWGTVGDETPPPPPGPCDGGDEGVHVTIDGGAPPVY